MLSCSLPQLTKPRPLLRPRLSQVLPNWFPNSNQQLPVPLSMSLSQMRRLLTSTPQVITVTEYSSRSVIGRLRSTAKTSLLIGKLAELSAEHSRNVYGRTTKVHGNSALPAGLNSLTQPLPAILLQLRPTPALLISLLLVNRQEGKLMLP